MNLFRYLILGVDPNKKTVFAGCTYDDIRPASAAAYQYQKLGVSPVLLDFAIVDFALEDPNADGIQPHSLRGHVPPPQPIRISPANPTVSRYIAPFMVLAQHPDKTFDYCLHATQPPAATAALAMARKGYGCAVIDLVRGLYVQQFVPGGKNQELKLSIAVAPRKQFVLGRFRFEYDPLAQDSTGGLDGVAWDILLETDDLQEACDRAVEIRSCLFYDRDNDLRLSTQSLRDLAPENYPRVERWLLENEMRFASGSTPATVADLVTGLMGYQDNLPRRSLQSAADRAGDWVRDFPLEQ